MRNIEKTMANLEQIKFIKMNGITIANMLDLAALLD